MLMVVRIQGGLGWWWVWGEPPRGLGEEQQLQHFESLEQLPCSDLENNSGGAHTFQPRPPATALP